MVGRQRQIMWCTVCLLATIVLMYHHFMDNPYHPHTKLKHFFTSLTDEQLELLESETLKEVQNLYRPLIQVFYEPLCPDSKHFIRTQLAPAMEKLSSYVRLDLVPYGKATTIEEGGVLKFQCQHGPNECLANKIHGCALDAVPDQLQQIRVVDCMIADNYKPKEVGQKCVKEHDGLDNWMKVFQCYSANRGDQILKHMGAITNSLDPAVSFIPTITIDGSQVGQRSMLRDLTRELCKRLKKDKPSVCL